MDKAQERMCDIIYETLRANDLPLGNRAFIADICSEALYKEGYRKVKGKPPLLSKDILLFHAIDAQIMGITNDGMVGALKLLAGRQRQSDIKWYEGG